MGQSLGFASELPLGPELALLSMNHREFLAKPRRAGRPTAGCESRWTITFVVSKGLNSITITESQPPGIPLPMVRALGKLARYEASLIKPDEAVIGTRCILP